MIENRLELNQQLLHKLPEGTKIFSYNRSRDKNKVKKEGLKLASVGARSGKILKQGDGLCGEIIIITTNTDIIAFVNSYDFTTLVRTDGINQKKQLDNWKVRKVVSEWYYGNRK